MSGIDRTHAKRLTRISQVCAALVIAGGVLAFTVSPGLPDAPVIVPIDTHEPEKRPSKPPYRIDAGLMGTTLNVAAAVEPKLDEPPPVIVKPEADPIVEAADTGYRFLGGFFSPKQSFAIVAGAGKQRMIRVGDELDFGYTVESIAADAIELSREGVTERITRETASGAVVGTSAPITAQAPADSVAPGTVVSPSARELLAERARQRGSEGNSEADRQKLRDSYERRRQQRLEELRESGVEVEDSDWRGDE